TGRPVPARNAQALRAAGYPAPPWSARDPRARESAPAAPWSDLSRARAPESDDDQCAPAHRSRTRQTGQTYRPTRETVRERPRPDWDAAPTPAAARGTVPAAPPHHARTWQPEAPRPPRRTPSRRASPTPNQRQRNCPSQILLRSDFAGQRGDKEVPWRTLIDRPSTWGYVLLPLAAPHPRREGLVCSWPCTGLAVLALSRRRARQQQDGL